MYPFPKFEKKKKNFKKFEKLALLEKTLELVKLIFSPKTTNFF